MFCSLSQDSELIYLVHHVNLSVGHHNHSDNTSYSHHRHPPVVPVGSHLSSPTLQCPRRWLIPCLCFYVLFCFVFGYVPRQAFPQQCLPDLQLPSLTANLSLAFQNSLYIYLMPFFVLYLLWGMDLIIFAWDSCLISVSLSARERTFFWSILLILQFYVTVHAAGAK